MFRFEVGARVLLKKYDWDYKDQAIEGEILDKAPNYIKVRILSGCWFSINSIHWIFDGAWYVVRRVGNKSH